MLVPEPPFETERRYLPQTNMLETVYRSADGAARVTEAFTLDGGAPPPWREFVRRVEGLEGSLRFSWAVEPRFDYGKREAAFARAADGFVADGPGYRIGVLAWEAGEPRASDGGAVLSGSFTTHEGSRGTLCLVGDGERPLRLPSRESVERRLEGTVDDWRRWLARSSYDGGWRDAVERSLLALKLLQNPETGAIAAAASTSLPEVIGGERNMDYRFGWIRDIAFTLEALMRLGFEDDAHLSYLWLADASRTAHPRPAPLHGLGGELAPRPSQLSLAGYRGSRPVKIGNQAVSELQLSGWGDLLQATWMHVERGGNVLDAESGERLADLVDVLAAIRRQPDSGLWELPERAQYTNSKIGCWVAFDRALKLAERGQVPPRHVDRWRSERDAVREFVEERLWSPNRNAYLLEGRRRRARLREPARSAAGLRRPGRRAAARNDRRAPRGARRGGSAALRYSGTREKENAFTACSFWLAEALALGRRFDEASALLDGLVERAGALGLYSEELEPGTGTLVGNYPQALTHLSLLSAAALFEEALAEADAERSPHRAEQPQVQRQEAQPLERVSPLEPH